MLINPIHAAAPVPPLEPSPYLPESRRFLNVTYIRPQDIPEYAHTATRPTVRAQVDASARFGGRASQRQNRPRWTSIPRWWHKRPALQPDLRSGPRSDERRGSRSTRSRTAAGPDLRRLRRMVPVAFQVWGAPWARHRWFIETRTVDSTRSRAPARARARTTWSSSNRWLQWIAAEQVTRRAAAPRRDQRHGARPHAGHGRGRARARRGRLVPIRNASPSGGVTVGCPPDFYNQQGQDWGQPPFNPRYLARPPATGVYREMVHNDVRARGRGAHRPCAGLVPPVVDSAGRSAPAAART